MEHKNITKTKVKRKKRTSTNTKTKRLFQKDVSKKKKELL
jgi:hypothetical protein